MCANKIELMARCDESKNQHCLEHDLKHERDEKQAGKIRQTGGNSTVPHIHPTEQTLSHSHIHTNTCAENQFTEKTKSVKSNKKDTGRRINSQMRRCQNVDINTHLMF